MIIIFYSYQLGYYVIPFPGHSHSNVWGEATSNDIACDLEQHPLFLFNWSLILDISPTTVSEEASITSYDISTDEKIQERLHMPCERSRQYQRIYHMIELRDLPIRSGITNNIAVTW